jgi:hypothetical protein
MGLFDTIIFDKSVIQGIDPKIDKYLTFLGDKQVGLQTKDLDCCMSSFLIEEGKLIIDDVKYEYIEGTGPFGGHYNEISREKKLHNLTCTIKAYDFLNSSPVDIWIELKFVFVDGVLQKISLSEYEETDSAERLERLAKFQKEVSESIKFGKTFRGKMQRAFGNFLGLVSRKIINLGDYIRLISYKL